MVARIAALPLLLLFFPSCCASATTQAGIAGEPSFEDFLWATSIFWSRGLALPLTYTDTQPAATSQQQEGGGSSGGTSSGGIVRIKVLEGLVPGLDFANHSEQVKGIGFVGVASKRGCVGVEGNICQGRWQQPGSQHECTAAIKCNSGSNSSV